DAPAEYANAAAIPGMTAELVERAVAFGHSAAFRRGRRESPSQLRGSGVMPRENGGDEEEGDDRARVHGGGMRRRAGARGDRERRGHREPGGHLRLRARRVRRRREAPRELRRRPRLLGGDPGGG